MGVRTTVKSLLGLDGIEFRFTVGEAYWGVGLSMVSGFLFGVSFVPCLVKLGLMAG